MKYKKLTDGEVQKIRLLVNRGKSLNQISEIMNTSKTTVYYHFVNFKGRTYQQPLIQETQSEMLGEFLGLFAGDGNIFITKQYNHRVFLFFGPNEGDFREEIFHMLTNLFTKEPCKSRRQNLLILYYSSKQIINLIKKYLVWDKGDKKTYSVRLKQVDHSREFKIGFLRGSVDSDGHISKHKITFNSTSLHLIKNICKFLRDLRIKYTYSKYLDKRINRKPMHNVLIPKKERKEFFEIIKPRNIKGLNAPAGIRNSECQP